MFCSRHRVCDPFRVGRFGYPVSGGVAALNPRLISRIPSGCRSATLRAAASPIFSAHRLSRKESGTRSCCGSQTRGPQRGDKTMDRARSHTPMHTRQCSACCCQSASMTADVRRRASHKDVRAVPPSRAPRPNGISPNAPNSPPPAVALRSAAWSARTP